MKKLTKVEKAWISYDIANSAFILLATTILPVVFNKVAEKSLDPSQYLAYWGYAVSISTLFTAFLGPILGTVADRKGKMPFFKLFLFIGIPALFILSFISNWTVFLIFFVLARIGFNGANVFYDSMLVDVSPVENRDVVSSYGFAWGYIGSCIPFIISIGLIIFSDKIGISVMQATNFSFIITGLWWLIFSLPLIKTYQQKYFYEEESHINNMVKDTFSELFSTLKDIVKDKQVLIFLLAFFFYIDGVSTIINMATAYGQSLGLDANMLILALLMTQFVAFPATLVFARASKKVATSKLLQICIIGYTVITLFAIQLDKIWEFWLLAFAVGLFQGAVQSLSRSHFSKIIPANESGRYFGIYDIFGKGASFFGTMTVALVSQITGKQQIGIGFLLIFFIVGFILFNYSNTLSEN